MLSVKYIKNILHMALVICGLFMNVYSACAAPVAQKGVLSAPNWQYLGQKLLLVGEWQVIWGELVSPAEFDAKYTDDYFQMPNHWNDVIHPKMNGQYGIATFRLKLDLPQYDKPLSVLIVSPNSAWNYYSNGKLLGKNGVASADLDVYETHYIPRTFSMPSGTSEIVLQVANFTNAHGGAEYAMAVWDANELTMFHDLMSLFFALALGILLSIGLIHMVFYVADRKHREQGPVHLWFSLLCFLLVIRVFGVIPFFHNYTPELAYWSSLFLPYFTLFAAPAVYLLFFRAAFPHEFRNKLTLYIIWLCIILSGLTIILPESLYTLTKNFAIGLNVFAIIYSIIFNIIAIKNRRAGAVAILVSNFVFFLTAINDSVLHIGSGNGFDLTPFGIVVLSLGYSYALLLRLQKTFDKARDVSKKLEVLNVELEHQVSDRTRAFEAAAAKAENNALEKAQFIAAASHDLRQPLHALSMFNFALKRRVEDKRLTDLIDKQASAIKSLSTLLQDTLDVSQTDSLKRKPKLSEVDVSTLMDEIINNYIIRAESQNLSLVHNTQTGQILTDSTMLKRILGNLIDNALKAAKSFVEINVVVSDAEWKFSISDDGGGIHQADVYRIFDSYISLDDQQPNEVGGYGLGLYVVKEFTQLMDGTIKVSSTSESGSTFTLSLPNLDNKQSVLMSPDVEQFDMPTLDIKILTIDDEPEVLDAMQNLLESWGCEVYAANGLGQANSCFDNGFMPDALIVDFHLHGANGVAAIVQLRQKYKQDLPAIIITGATQPAILEQISQAGLEYLPKPIDAHRLSTYLYQLKPNLL